MKNVGCIQSFSGRNAFIVSEDLGAIERLEQSLVKLGMNRPRFTRHIFAS